MFVEASDRDRPPRSVISLTQIHTFLTLVEEGGVARASSRLGLGHSTVSAHTKLIAEELGQDQFRRLAGGMVVTPAGLEAYYRLRSVAMRAAFCLRYFRGGATRPPVYRSIRMPAGFPGSRLDAALDLASAELATLAPEICLLPAYGGDPARPAELAFQYAVDAAGSETILRDRWILIRAGASSGWPAANTPLTPAERLDGLDILVPRLPPALQAALTGLAQAAGATLRWSNAPLHEILARAAQSQNVSAIVPASLLNPAMVADPFECLPIDAGAFDPLVGISAGDDPRIASTLMVALRALPSRDGSPERKPEPDALSLKHCRSFLALYEEGNVGRAAQRLSIVQPALTVQLHRIEEQVGCALFVRSYHGLRITERADLLYGLIRPMMAEFNASLRVLRASAHAVSKSVRVGLIPALDDESLTAQGFATALDKWSGTYGDGVVSVVEGYSNTLVRWLQSGRIDFALIDRVFPDLGLTFDTIAEDAMVVVTDKGSGLLWPGPVTLEQLVKLPLVLPSSRHGLRTLLAQSLRERGLALEPRIEVDSMATCLSLVKIARYATILPMGSVYQSCDRRRLSIHEISEPRIVRKICLARARNDSCGEAALNFIGELRSAFAHTKAPAGAGLAREIA
jgi:DNA-binding transcriptional LysR family regulator